MTRCRAKISTCPAGSRSVVARIESCSQLPSLKTLERYAEAIGCTLTLSLRPAKKRLAS